MNSTSSHRTGTVLELALHAGNIGHWDMDLVHDSSRRSQRHDECFGYTAPVPRWGLHTFLQHLHPDDRTVVERKLHDAITRAVDWRSEFRVLWPDGSEHWLAASGAPYSIQDGRARRMVGVVADITQRKQAEIES